MHLFVNTNAEYWMKTTHTTTCLSLTRGTLFTHTHGFMSVSGMCHVGKWRAREREREFDASRVWCKWYVICQNCVRDYYLTVQYQLDRFKISLKRFLITNCEPDISIPKRKHLKFRYEFYNVYFKMINDIYDTWMDIGHRTEYNLLLLLKMEGKVWNWQLQLFRESMILTISGIDYCSQMKNAWK